MDNLLFLYLIEAERHRDRLAEANHYRLVKQVKQQKITERKHRLRSWFGILLEAWGCWLMERSAMLTNTNRNIQLKNILKPKCRKK